MVNQSYGSRKGMAGTPCRKKRKPAQSQAEYTDGNGIFRMAVALDWVTVGGLVIAGGVMFYVGEKSWGVIAWVASLIWAIGAWKQPGIRMLSHLRSRFVHRR